MIFNATHNNSAEVTEVTIIHRDSTLELYPRTCSYLCSCLSFVSFHGINKTRLVVTSHYVSIRSHLLFLLHTRSVLRVLQYERRLMYCVFVFWTYFFYIYNKSPLALDNISVNTSDQKGLLTIFHLRTWYVQNKHQNNYSRRNFLWNIG